MFDPTSRLVKIRKDTLTIPFNDGVLIVEKTIFISFTYPTTSSP